MQFFRGGGADAPGTVAFGSPCHFCSPLRYRNGHVSSHTRQVFYGSNGVNGSNGANGRNGRMWLIDSGLNRDEGLKLQKIGN